MQNSIDYRQKCIDELSTGTTTLSQYSNDIMRELDTYTAQHGTDWLLDLLRISSFIPECVIADSAEEKRYSKYTDTLLSFALQRAGLTSTVLDARGDAADVEAVGSIDGGKTLSVNMVGDAKVFRLSRTAKNQKDFKIDAMDKWKNGKPHAVLVCPIYQLPANQSRIYYTAEERNVCVLSYSHLCVLIKIKECLGTDKAVSTLHNVLENSFTLLNPSKSAADYWLSVNKAMIQGNAHIGTLWDVEKKTIVPMIQFGKEEGLEYYQNERTRILALPREAAIRELISLSGVDNKINVIERVAANNIFSM